MMGAFLLTAEKGEWIKALSQFNTWAGATQSRRLTLIHKDDLMFRLGGIVFALNQEKAA